MIQALMITLYLCFDTVKTCSTLYTNSKDLYTFQKCNNVTSNNGANKLATMLFVRKVSNVVPTSYTKEFICDNLLSLHDYYECNLTYYLDKEVIKHACELKNHQYILIMESPIVYIVKIGDMFRVLTIFT